jgi:carbamoyltransferase
MNILGISAFYHDSAAALVKDGEIIAAAQEERFTRKKHDPSFPINSIYFCLKSQNLSFQDLDYIVFYEKPFLKFERLLETYLAFSPFGFRSFSKSMPVWIKEKLFQKNLLLKKFKELAPSLDIEKKLLFSEHHLSHAASAYYPSGFDKAIVLTMDGVGEWTSTSVAIGKGKDLEIVKEIHFPHSLGLLYSAMTYYTGFKVNSGEYKVMGLAPYGEPKYANLILEHLIDLKPDGSYKLNLEYFNYCTGLTMTNEKFHKLFGGPPRKPEQKLTQKDMDLAASIQKVTEEVMLTLTRSLKKEYGISNLCMAGGVALNCVANGKILKEGNYEKIFIQPASGDAGGAIGAALAVNYLFLGQELVASSKDRMKGSYLGPEFSQTEIEHRLQKIGAKFEVLTEEQLYKECVEGLVKEKALGWFQGKMEFGPRALGGRSILGDPRSPKMQSQLNLKVKYRESFRPFAPAVLREEVHNWFELDVDSPYMLLVADVHSKIKIKMTEAQEKLFGIEKLNVPRSSIPAVTHVDYSARIQTVHFDTNPRFYNLLKKFHQETGCPVLVNTSFNVRGEPIVNTPEDAFRCFMGTEIELLAIGNCLLRKENQDPSLKLNYKDAFELD